MSSVPSIVFLCVHNAGRSQMAAAWARHLGGDSVEVFSGGSEPAAGVNPAAVASMAEAGIDLGSAVPQRWTHEIVRGADVVVTMGCGDECPLYPGVRYEDWPIPDPAGLSPAEVAPIRDEIRDRVAGLLSSLGVAGTEPGSDWTTPLVLASASARRRELLETVGVPIEVVAADVDETLEPGMEAATAVQMLARRKAEAIAAAHPDRAVLAADTLVAIDGSLLGKPAGPDEARTMLRTLAGRWHDVLTGVVLHTGEQTIGRVAVTEVRIADLTGAEIERYVAGPEPYDKAGGYGIQAVAGWFVAEIRGSYSNVMGLPLEVVREMLAEAGLPIPRLGS